MRFVVPEPTALVVKSKLCCGRAAPSEVDVALCVGITFWVGVAFCARAAGAMKIKDSTIKTLTCGMYI
jgi:hypothetical protein